MKIIGIEGLPPQQIAEELQRGAKFVVFQYCISIVVMTFSRSSDVHYIRPGENAVSKGVSFTLLSCVLGWWGFPWGPIRTIGAIITNGRGGKDVTAQLAGQFLAAAYQPPSSVYPPPPAYPGSPIPPYQ